MPGVIPTPHPPPSLTIRGSQEMWAFKWIKVQLVFSDTRLARSNGLDCGDVSWIGLHVASVGGLWCCSVEPLASVTRELAVCVCVKSRDYIWFCCKVYTKHYRQVFGSPASYSLNSWFQAQRPPILTGVFHGSPQPTRHMMGQYLKLDHKCLLPCPFQFTIC
jgi:hypothetical protein